MLDQAYGSIVVKLFFFVLMFCDDTQEHFDNVIKTKPALTKPTML